MNQRDLVLEYLQHLTFNDIRNLCQSNIFYREFCNTPQAKELIKKNILHIKQNKSYP